MGHVLSTVTGSVILCDFRGSLFGFLLRAGESIQEFDVSDNL